MNVAFYILTIFEFHQPSSVSSRDPYRLTLVYTWGQVRMSLCFIFARSKVMRHFRRSQNETN